MSARCGCCQGTEPVTPESTANRPGLPALAYRVGTRASFLETMLARLPGAAVPAGETGEGPGTINPLAPLAVRTGDDPAIAFLDAWATVADVVTFYQERIANEGYLRTATERRSLVELARLTGYEPRPGVAAAVHLAFDLEDGYRMELPQGIRAQSVPAPGETMQPFETGDRVECRSEWNRLKPRATEPHLLRPGGNPCELYLRGITTGLAPGDWLLADFGPAPELYRVAAVETDAPADRTRVSLLCQPREGTQAPGPVAATAVAAPLRVVAAPLRVAAGALQKAHTSGTAAAARLLLGEATRIERAGDPAATADVAAAREALERAAELVDQGATGRLREQLAEQGAALDRLSGADPTAPPADRTALGHILDVEALATPPSRPPPGARGMPRDSAVAFGPASTAVTSLLAAFDPRLERTLFAAWGAARVPTGGVPQEVFAFRVKAMPFGATAPRRQRCDDRNLLEPVEWDLNEGVTFGQGTARLDLDAVYDRVLPGSRVLVAREGQVVPEPFRATAATPVARASYGITGRSTRLVLDRPWLTIPRGEGEVPPPTLALLRGVSVWAQSEALALAERPVTDDVAGSVIDLDGLYPGLQAGRWVIVAGERTDLPGTTGAELAMVAGVRNATVSSGAGEDAVPLPGDRVHTWLLLANPLAYTYRRATVQIYGNVAKATHGETREQVLGSGDGNAAPQQFILQQGPLTYLAAATPRGTESTLTVRVDGVRWDEAPHLAALAPASRAYLVRIDDDGKTRVVFGDGARGARLPTGSENVAAVYRTGIGSPGNVTAGQITLLATRPAGLKAVVNPLPATGGGDRDGPEEIRRNIPLGLLSLDRVVSVQDYADFARTFAGIGKAEAAFLTDGRRPVVHLTVAGVDDAPISRESELFAALVRALRRYGDPHRSLVVERRELRLLLVGARVRVDPRRLWGAVEPLVRAALLGRFGFARRALGQGVAASEVVAAIHGVAGVEAVELRYLTAVGEAELRDALDDPASLTRTLRPYVPARLARPDPDRPFRTAPAELVIFSPAVPDTLTLTEWTA